jgi:hypothetical protein
MVWLTRIDYYYYYYSKTGSNTSGWHMAGHFCLCLQYVVCANFCEGALEDDAYTLASLLACHVLLFPGVPGSVLISMQFSYFCCAP